MYKVYCDGYLLYDDALENMRIYDASIELEVNKTGSFVFTIYPEHPYFNLIKKITSIVTVYQEDYLLFRGRVLNLEIGFYNEKTIECEGDLSFLLDTIVRPYNFNKKKSVFFTDLITAHNAGVSAEKRFTVGRINLPTDYSTHYEAKEYRTTYAAIQLILNDGCVVSTRYENGVAYIDFECDVTRLSNQTIEFAKNLLDMKRIKKGEEIYTALIPLGAKIEGTEDERLTIASVNEGKDYIQDDDAVALYGFICKTQEFDDITDASELLTSGRTHLSSLVENDETIELTAADLASIDETVNSFHLGTYVRVTSNPHGIDQTFMVRKLTIDLMNPESNKLILGGIVKTLTDKTASVQFIRGEDGKDGKDGQDGKDGKDAAIQSMTAPSDTSYLWLDISVDPPLMKRYNPDTSEWDVVNDTADIVYNLEQSFISGIDQNKDSIMLSVSEIYTLKDDFDTVVKDLGTQITQTAQSVEIQFNNFEADIEQIASGADAEFEEIRKYIRFIDGKILLGQEGNQLELEISNDKISFLQEGSEVAYFSNHKLFVTDGEYTNSLRLGKFAFLPRDNGNLSFKMIT